MKATLAGKLAMLKARTVGASRGVSSLHGNPCIALPLQRWARSVLATGVAIILILFLLLTTCLPSVSGQVIENPIIDKPVAIGKEVVSLRTEYSKTYYLGGDHYQIKTGGGIVHWKNNYDNPDEPWQDPELVWYNGWITQAPYILVDRGGWYSFQDRKTGEVTTIEPLSVSVSKNEATFRVVPFVDGVSFQYTITADQLPFEAKYKVDGNAVIVSRAWDDAGEFQLTTTLKDGVLTERLDTLKDATTGKNRSSSGTIRIDPTTTVQPPTKDGLIAGNAKTTNYGNLILLAVARDPGLAPWTYYRSIIHLDMPADPGGAVVNNVTLYMYKYFDLAGYGCTAAEAHELTQTAWVEMEATWNIYSTGNNWANPGGDYAAAVIDLTNDVQPFGVYGWEYWVINGTAADNSLELDWGDPVHLEMKYPEVANKKYEHWYSKDYGVDPAKRPYLLIDYTALMPPTVVTVEDTAVGYTWVNMCGNITDIGSGNVTHRGLSWGLSPGANTWNWGEYGSWNETGVYCHNTTTGITSCNQTIYFTAWAANYVDYGYGSEVAVNTTSCNPPTVVTINATDIGCSTATVGGNITDDDGVPVESRGFQWDTDSGSPPFTFDWSESGTYGMGDFSHNLTSLGVGTTYYYRPYATSPGGIGFGNYSTFATLPLPLCPTNITATQTGINQITLSWTMGVNATGTIVRVMEDGSPTSLAEGYEVYNGSDTSVNLTLSAEWNKYGVSLWGTNPCGTSVCYTTFEIGGNMILVLVLALLALGLTVAMFTTKNSMLGFACAIFWAIFAGANYLNSTATWDIYYLMFFAGIGMVLFTMFGAFGLRKKDLAGPDADKGAFIDEKNRTKIQYADDYGETGEEDPFDIDKLPMHGLPDSSLNWRSRGYSGRLHDRLNSKNLALHDRARRRRANWGDLS